MLGTQARDFLILSCRRAVGTLNGRFLGPSVKWISWPGKDPEMRRAARRGPWKTSRRANESEEKVPEIQGIEAERACSSLHQVRGSFTPVLKTKDDCRSMQRLPLPALPSLPNTARPPGTIIQPDTVSGMLQVATSVQRKSK